MRINLGAQGLRWIERALFALGIICLAWYGIVAAGAAFYQDREKAVLDQLLATKTLPGDAGRPDARQMTVGRG